jgi:hypothetical protein
LTAIRLAEAQLAVPSGEALQAFLPSHVTKFSPSIAHKFRRGTDSITSSGNERHDTE